MKDKKIYLVDATAFCYRAFYALKDLKTSFGLPTNAIYGFVNMLNKLLSEHKPEYIGVCFDVSRDTFRQKKYAEYKMQRPPMPDGLAEQMGYIKEIITASGIKLIEKEGFEADDIIATITKRARQAGFCVVIISSDKDMLQLVGEGVVVISPHKDGDIVYDQDKVVERFGVKPSSIIDIISLMGDDVDNIPGVKGIGEKTAVSLVKVFGSADELISRVDEVKQEKIRSSIIDNAEIIRLSRELALLDSNVDIDFSLQDLRPVGPDNNALARLYKHLEFKKWLKDLDKNEPANNEHKQEVLAIPDSQLSSIIKGANLLYLSGQSFDSLYLSTGKDFFKVNNPGQNLRIVLQDPSILKIGHNLKRLKFVLARENVDLKGLYFDTMIAGYVLNPAKANNLISDIAFDYLDRPVKFNPDDGISSLELIIELKELLEDELNKKSLINLFKEIEMPMAEVLSEMEIGGIKIDSKLLNDISKELEKRLIALVDDIYKLSGTQFNINSPKQLRDVLFERLKLPVVRRSKTGPSTDEGVLTTLAKKHELPALLLEYRQLTKLKNTYIDTLPNLVNKDTGMLHTSFNQTLTETGRLSSSNPNLQNIPVKTEIGRQIRRAVIAFDKGSRLLSCDYSQIELRVLAHLSKDENLISAFRNNKDIHKATASLIYSVEEPQVQDYMRETAKRVNFGIIYGLTSFGLSRDLDISQDEAQSFIDAYFIRFPKVKEYINSQIDTAQKNGFVTTLLGRRRYLPDISSKNQSIRQLAQRQAVNTPIQGSASDLIKLAMIRIQKEISAARLKSKMILQVHDELIFNVPNGEMDVFSKMVKNAMEHVLVLDVPITVDMKSGLNWLDMKELKLND
ncbi:MAG: DNA polymerase I [Candidatus Omnitrophota bacterium]|jgi:DNA polymerase-1|nr:MAG: DNA polymerase I [Candidatus Omnitrophota bacterium]